MGCTVDHRIHRVIAPLQYLAIVKQKSVGNILQAVDGFVIVDGNWFFAQVGAGHDKSPHTPVRKEEVLQRGVGQKHPQPRNTGRDGGRDAIAQACASQNDGARRSKQQCLFIRGEVAQLAR